MLLDLLDGLIRIANSTVRNNLGSKLAAKDSTLHRSEELLRSPVTSHGEVGNRSGLGRTVLIPSRNSGVNTSWNLDNGILLKLGLSVGSLLGSRRPPLIIGNVLGEQTSELTHGSINDLLIRLGNPVDLTTGNRTAGGKHQLKHRLIGILVLLASDGHISIHRKQRGTREAEMIHSRQLAIEPHVQVDNGDALELIKLTEVGHLLPLLGDHALHNVHGHGRNVFVGLDLLSTPQEQVVDGTILVGNDLLDRSVHNNLSASLLNVLLHGLAETIGLVAIEEGHLQTVRLVEEAIHGSKDDRHGKLIGIDEIESLGHSNKDLLVNALWHAILAHEVGNGELVLSIDEVLSLDEHGNEWRSGLELLAEGKHLLVHENSKAKVKGGRNSRDEVEGGELSGKLLHGEDHLMDLPLETIMDAELWIRDKASG